MKKYYLLVLAFFISAGCFAQQKDQADKIVEEGVALHDKGDYDGAISLYNKALELDKENILAMAEKSLTLNAQQKYDESIALCKKALEKHGEDKLALTIYSNYANALDAQNKTDKALEIYDRGIKQFPDAYRILFDKGVCLSGAKRYEEALLCFEAAVKLNPRHPGSHNGIARMELTVNHRIPALLSLCRFLILEPEGKRAASNLEYVQAIMKGNVEKTGKKSITVSVSPDMLDTSAAKPDNFSSTGLILAMDAALDYDKKYKKLSPAEQFLRKFNTACSSLAETRSKGHGFFWEFYAPYFIEMKEKNLTETFSYIIFSSSGDKDVTKWLKNNQGEVTKFYDWSKGFAWKTN
jgi:tetratricopeptide (TPR) repeat protein